MRKLFTPIFLFLVGSGAFAQTTYYNCATAPATTSNLATDQAGSNCGTTRSTWDVVSNTAIIQSGSSYFVLTASNTDSLEASLTVNSGGSLSFASSGNVRSIIIAQTSTFTVNGSVDASSNVEMVNNGTMIVGSGGSLDNTGSNNNIITISGGGTAIIDGTLSARNLIIESGGEVQLNGTIDANVSVQNDGVINGSGSITGSATISGTGSFNGESLTNVSLSSPINLGEIGYVWNGTQWASNQSSDTKVSLSSSDKGFIDGTDYNTSSGDLDAAIIEVASGSTLTISDNDSVKISNTLLNKGTIALTDNAVLKAEEIPDTNSGNFTITRNVSRVGWHNVGFPVATNTLTVGDLNSTFSLVLDQTTDHTVFAWNSSTAVWDQALSSTTLQGNAFSIYARTQPTNFSLTIPNNAFNDTNISVSYNYFDPGTPTSGSTSNGTSWATAVTDGWNHWINPFPSYLDWNNVSEFPGGVGSAIYVWNGSSYVSWNGGVGSNDARFVSPYQSFFVRNSTNTSGTFEMQKSFAVVNPSNATDLFKAASGAVVLNLKGASDSIDTYIAERNDATDLFDAQYDAHYYQGLSHVPVFNSVGSDSTMYSIQCVKDLESSNLYLSFSHEQNGPPETFTISLRESLPIPYNHLYLQDLHLNKIHDLNASAYSFVDDDQSVVQRFKLVFATGPISVDEGVSVEPIYSWFNDDLLRIGTPDRLKVTDVELYTLGGQLYKRWNSDDIMRVKDQGIYLLRVRTDDNQQHQLLIRR